MSILLFDEFNGCSTSIKEINRLIIWKGMSNIYYWEKLTFSKLRFSRKENLKKCINFEEQKGIFKTLSQISFKLFCSGDKRLLSEFFQKWGWFQGHNERFPKYLA